MNPYLRASKKFPKVKAQAQNRLDKLQGNPPVKPAKGK